MRILIRNDKVWIMRRYKKHPDVKWKNKTGIQVAINLLHVDSGDHMIISKSAHLS